MIQRIQSIYLISVTILSGLLVFMLPFYNLQSELSNLRSFLVAEDWRYQLVVGLFVAVAVLSFYTIFNYKNRKRQIFLNYTGIFLNVLLLGLLIYIYSHLSGELLVSMKGIGVFTPLVSIVLLLLANNAIQKDENLVKSVDRIR